MSEESDNLQERNLSALFNAFDTNQDGTITAEDFDLTARQLICEPFGIAVDSERGRTICESFQAVWNLFQHNLDADNDGTVTFAEFTAVGEGGLAELKASIGAELGQATRLVAEAIDADQDGYLSQDEYLRLLGPAATDDQAALAGFRELDVDGDGRISADEFQAGIIQMLFSSDPAAAGTSLLGQG